METFEVQDKKFIAFMNGSKLSWREVKNGNLNADAEVIPLNFPSEGISTFHSKMLIFNKNECMYIDGDSTNNDEKHVFTRLQGSPFYVKDLKRIILI